ncbi:MAG: polyribonucleotide nucleotidyltransferase [Parcubacteria group bacterium Gr01-1014_33]|nr:MAG: polyribonucleotide nucleotidyltransferase [Parcubacteria group bacterium Gr01-1014_33]
MESHKYSHTVEGKTFQVELTNWAEQANGSVLVRLGDTMVLATAVMARTPREGGDYFPLMVDYEEKFYATGKILGSRFIKRETRPSEEATLVSRLIDRSIRPRFDMRMRNEVQVVITVLSIDDQNDPDVPSLFAASLALSLSDIPWQGPVAGVRIGKKEGKEILNPAYPEREGSALDVIVSGTKERINMLEAGAREITEDEFAHALEWGSKFIKDLISFQEGIVKTHGREKASPSLLPAPEELTTILKKDFSERIEQAVYQKDKKIMHESVEEVKAKWLEVAWRAYPDVFQKNAAEYLFDQEIDAIVHKRIIENGERPDGRKTNELRPLNALVGILPRVHGSGLFMRGQTHVLSTLTLGAPGDEQIVEGMEIRTKKRFLHHYNFPPFSTGEVKPMRGPGRREIGHGALAGKALLPLIPSREEFPYTIRIVSEVLSSNGSSSMASVCGSSLALMDAGVPIKKAAAGAAMGLILNAKGEYKVLTDIQGPEDHYGDMDFKVAGTKDGITAVQMDVKIEGITLSMIRDTLHAAHTARMKILEVMDAVISTPREELSQWAPRVNILKINPEKIGALIGPGGKVINEIIAQTGAQIDIEDDGTVFITSVTEDGMARAISLVKQITREIKSGELLEGKVTRILDFGAMVEVGPRQEGLIHISELAPWRVDRVTDIVQLGDIVPVKVRNIDEQGRINLSLKDVPGKYSEEEHHEARESDKNTRYPQHPSLSPRHRK